VGDANNPYKVLIEGISKKFRTYEIHSQTKIIAACAFINCENLSSITIPASVKGIGWKAFVRCEKLENVTFENPNGWSYIDSKSAKFAIPANKLSYKVTAADCLRDLYLSYDWVRK